MTKFETYRSAFSNAQLSRKPNGVLEVGLHTDGGKLEHFPVGLNRVDFGGFPSACE